MSQGDLDTLLQSLAGEQPVPEAVAQERIRKYDFRRPGKFAKDQLRTLTMLHEIFARLMTSFLVGHLRSRVQVTVAAGEQMTYQQFMQGLPNPTVLATFRLRPLPGLCLLHLSGSLALTIVDRIYGGAGAPDQPKRALTEIEQSVVRKVFDQAMTCLGEAWQRVIEVQPQLEGIEVNPLFVQVAMPGEVVALITLNVDAGLQQGQLVLALPFGTVEPVLARLSPQSWLASTREQAPEQSRELRRRVEQCRVRLVARLGQAELPVRDFLRLDVGSVVVLEQRVADEVPLYVGNQLAFYGRPGVTGGRMMVTVRRRARGPADGAGDGKTGG